MKKFTLTFAAIFLAIVSVANAESSTNPTTAKQDAPPSASVIKNSQAQAERLTYADFRIIHRQIDFNYQRLKSVRLAALECHMSLDRVNHLFQRFAHESADQYFANLKRASGVPFQTL